MNDSVELLRKVKIRATTHRIAILDVLTRAKTPISAEELHARVGDADLVTIYRSLEQLRAAGLIRDVRFKDAITRYEMAHGGHHHHLVCTHCGHIDELPECNVHSLERNALAASNAFASIEEHALEFFGTCTTCARQ